VLGVDRVRGVARRVRDRGPHARLRRGRARGAAAAPARARCGRARADDRGGHPRPPRADVGDGDPAHGRREHGADDDRGRGVPGRPGAPATPTRADFGYPSGARTLLQLSWSGRTPLTVRIDGARLTFQIASDPPIAVVVPPGSTAQSVADLLASRVVDGA